MPRISLLVAVACVVSAAAAPLSATPCPFDWRPGQSLPGTTGTVYAMTTWDSDGAGPKPEWLIAGGVLSVADNALANNIVAWDGTGWQALGSGMNDYVYALTAYNGTLIAGGGHHPGVSIGW